MTNGDFAFFSYQIVHGDKTERPWEFAVADADELTPHRMKAFYVQKQVRPVTASLSPYCRFKVAINDRGYLVRPYSTEDRQ